MVKVSKDNLNKYFLFNDDVVFGTVSRLGCKCLDRVYSSSLRGMAMEDGFYILGIGIKDDVGCSPLINVMYKDGEKRCDYVYVLGEYRDGKMYEIITDREIKYVDDIDVIHFKAPYDFVRYSNTTWQELPIIGDEEYEPGYYFSDLCYVNCNKVDVSAVIEYLEYFNNKFVDFISLYNKSLDSLIKKYKFEYNKIKEAYDTEKKNVIDNKKEKVLSHNYSMK